MNSGRRHLLVGGVFGLCGVASVAARSVSLEQPTGAPVLTLRGKVSVTNGAGAAHFDMSMLARMPQRSLTTRTPWFESPRKFTGPLLRDVLSAAGAQGTSLRAIALNDYMVDIPLEDAQKFEVVMARLIDDKPIAVREKGPLFIIYPFDDRAELRSAVYYSRCAWQLRTLEIV